MTDEQILRCLDGAADPGEEAELREQLLIDEDARHRFAFLACQQQAFVDLLRGAAAEQRPTLRRFVRRHVATERGPLLAVAAMLLFGISVLAALILSRPGSPRPAEVRRKPEPLPEVRIAPREEPVRREEALPPKPPLPVREPAPAPVAEQRPVDPPPAPLLQPDPKPAPAPTVVAMPVVAALLNIKGEVSIVAAGAKSPAGETLLEGQGIETGPAASVTLRFTDATTIDLAPSTTLSELKTAKGRRVVVAAGTITATVTKQPADQPMLVVTPHAELKVLGTTLKVVVQAASTQLDVLEGRVQMKRLSDRRTVEVAGEHYAVAATGVDLVPKVRYPDTKPGTLLGRLGAVTIGFGSAAPSLPDGVVLDSGEKFDDRGYGWTQGKVVAGRSPGITDPLQAGFIGGGSADETATWKLSLPNGRYLVSVSVGGPGAFAADQGPHHVSVEGVQIFDAVMTRNARFQVRKEIPVVVTRHELTMIIGGHKSAMKTADGTSDTVVNYIIVRRVP